LNAIDDILEGMLHAQECDLLFWGAGMIDEYLKVIDVCDDARTDAPQDLNRVCRHF
jgi:hypothetical protein